MPFGGHPFRLDFIISLKNIAVPSRQMLVFLRFKVRVTFMVGGRIDIQIITIASCKI